MTLSIMTLSIMTLSIKGLFVTLSINDIQHKKDIEHDKNALMLSVFVLSFVMLNVIATATKKEKKRRSLPLEGRRQ
jgi:hypothetical protein